MIPDVDRYHGIALRQLLVGIGRPVTLGVSDFVGRADCFVVNGGAFQIKHSSKRLPPWQFTYLSEQVRELRELATRHEPVWVVLVCGVDGVVGCPLPQFLGLIDGANGNSWSVRVRRERHSMYRLSGPNGDLARPRPRGLYGFIESLGMGKQAE